MASHSGPLGITSDARANKLHNSSSDSINFNVYTSWCRIRWFPNYSPGQTPNIKFNIKEYPDHKIINLLILCDAHKTYFYSDTLTTKWTFIIPIFYHLINCRTPLFTFFINSHFHQEFFFLESSCERISQGGKYLTGNIWVSEHEIWYKSEFF